ncbi:MAG: deoxyribonuclease V [Longimicrobiales bacterium]
MRRSGQDHATRLTVPEDEKDPPARLEVSPAEAKALQLRLRNRVILKPPPAFSPRLIAGADLSILRGRDVGHAAIVVLDEEELEVVDQATASVEVAFPYIPGLLSFRELPPLAAAWAQLEVRPAVVIFDAHGLAHPRRFGLACHGGLLFGVPSIGAAKSILVGRHGELGAAKGSTAPLLHEGDAVGAAVRTRSGVSPLYVSPGHRMDLPTAVRIVLSVSPRYRIPEPIRRAHRLSNETRAGPDP